MHRRSSCVLVASYVYDRSNFCRYKELENLFAKHNFNHVDKFVTLTLLDHGIELFA